MIQNRDHAEMIEAAITHEMWCRDTAAPEDLNFWDGWDAEAVRAGRVMATVVTSAPGNGFTVVVTARLAVLTDGKAVATVPDSEQVERVDSRVIRRAGGGEAYALKLARKLYGADVLVKFTHIV